MKSHVSCAVTLLMVAWAALLAAQELQVLSVRDFSGGWHPGVSPFHVKQNEASKLVNFFLDSTGALTRRPGFRSKTTGQAAGSEYKGLFSLTRRDGKEYLFGVQNDASDNWNHLMVSDPEAANKYALTDSLFSWLYKSMDPPQVAVWKSLAFMCDGYNHPVITDGEFARPMYLPAPGLPSIILIDSTGDIPEGWYRIAVQQCAHDSTVQAGASDSSISTLSEPFYIQTGQSILLKDFHHTLANKTLIDSLEQANMDTTKFYVLLTKPNQIEETDTLWRWRDPGPGGLHSVLAADIDDYTEIHTGLPDTTYAGYVQEPGLKILPGPGGEGNRARVFWSPGQVRMYEWDPCDTTLNEDLIGAWKRYGVDSGGANFFIGYNLTFYDTLLHVESDTCRRTWLWRDKRDTNVVVLLLPKIPPQFVNCVRRLYRCSGPTGLQYDTNTVVTFVGQIDNADDSLYRDTTSAASIQSGSEYFAPYYQSRPPTRPTGVFTFDDRLYEWGGQPDRANRLYYSRPDSARFGLFEYITFNLDDGDAIVYCVAAENAIVVFKNNSIHYVFEDANGDFTKASPAPYQLGGIGAVSKHGVLAWRGAVIFLHTSGLWISSTGEYRQEKIKPGPISENVNAVINYDIAELQQARMYIVDDRRLFLSFPDKDTTYVFFLDEPGSPAAIATFSIEQGAYFDANTGPEFYPSKDFVFLPGDDPDRVCLWADAATDDTGTYKQFTQAHYNSPLLLASRVLKEVKHLTIWQKSGDPDGQIAVRILGMNPGDTLIDVAMTTLDSLYAFFDVTTEDPQPGFYLNLQTSNQLDSCKIFGVDIDWLPAHPATKQ